MTYYQDLSEHTYSEGEGGAVNVGFLDSEHDFKRAPIPHELFAELNELSKTSYVQHRGFHVCELCEVPANLKEDRDYLSAWERPRSGSYLFKVEGKNGKQYICPSLLMHYISEHQYCPPTEFLEAVVGKTFEDYITEINGLFLRSGNPFKWKG